MSISTNQVRFLALTKIQHNVNIKQVTETALSAKVAELTSKYQSLLVNSGDLLNPFAIGDTIRIGNKISGILPDDALLDKNGEELAKIPTQATVKNISGNDISLKIGDNQVTVKVDDLTTAANKTQYTPEEFLSLTGNAELGEISFDSESYINYSVDTNVEQSIFVNGIMQAYAASAMGTKDTTLVNPTIGEEHANISSAYNSIKAVINEDDKKNLAFVG